MGPDLYTIRSKESLTGEGRAIFSQTRFDHQSLQRALQGASYLPSFSLEGSGSGAIGPHRGGGLDSA